MEVMNGMIVRSCAGRDKGNFLVIVQTDNDFVYLADGKERRLVAPKKKRLKHIKPTNTVIDMQSLTDKKLRSVIREYNSGG
ncbi:MAG: KOW domain-containing RNA-binding protein [Ruminococcus sp.]|nr:KOW domain-containing RNA-binding protein [Ruminococcus sp.]